MLSLPRSSDVQSVVDALVEAHGLRAGCIVVDTTSGIPAVSKAIAERLSSLGVDYLDFGVAGGPSGAAAARLSGMVGGSEAALRRAMPIVALFCNADAVHHMGPPGSGHAVKAVNNMLLAANIATATEALTLLRKAGVSSEAGIQPAICGDLRRVPWPAATPVRPGPGQVTVCSRRWRSARGRSGSGSTFFGAR